MLTSVRNVDEQPMVVVEPWVVLEVTLDSPPPDVPPPPWRFVVAYDPRARLGRVSTLIVEQDFAAKRVLTQSGRMYELRGPPAIDADAWHVWMERAGRVPVRDVSGDFWPGYIAGSAKLVDTWKASVERALQAQGMKVVEWLPAEEGDR